MLHRKYIISVLMPDGRALDTFSGETESEYPRMFKHACMICLNNIQGGVECTVLVHRNGKTYLYQYSKANVEPTPKKI